MKKITLILFAVISFSTIAQNNWEEVYSQEGKCSISFPTTPIKQSNPQTGGDVLMLLNSTSLMLFTAEDYSGRLRDYSDSNVHNEDALKALNGFFVTVDGEFISNKKIFYKGRKALDFYLTINFPNSNFKYAKGRYMIENNIIYMVIYYYSDYNQNEYSKFINSLEFN